MESKRKKQIHTKAYHSAHPILMKCFSDGSKFYKHDVLLLIGGLQEKPLFDRELLTCYLIKYHAI